ncbi:MAG: hypothetical protein P8X76_09320, partial [Maritimibacter sp.]
MAHKDKRGNTASFIKLDTWIFERPAYRRLGLGARCLHMELIRVYNGYNNGRLFLSHRLAADRLGCSRNTVSRYYRELEEASDLACAKLLDRDGPVPEVWSLGKQGHLRQLLPDDLADLHLARARDLDGCIVAQSEKQLAPLAAG